MIRTWGAATTVCLAALLLGAGCAEHDGAEWDAIPAGGHAPPGDTVPPRAPLDTTLEPGALATVQRAPVERWAGPGGRSFEVARRTAAPETGHARRFGTIALPIGLRTRSAGLTQFPCTACHQGLRVVMADTRIADAHENITPAHPEQTGGTCSTCHAPDDVALLPLQSGERATMDQSHRLCAQCHFPQANAWAGGAHGKRLDGWQGRRVVMACTDCHDPHRPVLQQRIPFRAPEIGRAPDHAP